MEIITYTKCACANCGCIIEYRASQAGEIVVCPRCSEKSVLPDPEKLLLVERLGPVIPEFRECPACHQEIAFYASACEHCKRLRRNRNWHIATAVTVIVTLAVVILLPLRLERIHDKQIRETAVQESIARADHKSLPIIMIQAPRKPTQSSLQNLVVRRYALERRDGNLMLAVGDLENVSEHSHVRLQINFDVLDKKGAKIGNVSDFCNELQPFQSWHFIATVTLTNAANIRFAGVTENK